MNDLRRHLGASGIPEDPGWASSPSVTSSGSLVDVHSLAVALRARWHLVATVALSIAVAGVIMSLVSTPRHTARAAILLRYPTGYDATQAVVTEVQLLRTRAVAEAAAARLGHGVTASDLVAGLRAKAVSEQLLQVEMTGPTGREAVRRGQALSESFLAFRNNLFDQQTQASVDALNARTAALQNDLADLNRQIDAQPAAVRAGDASVRGIGDLISARAAVAEQLSTIRQKIDTVVLDNTAVTSRSRVVDPAAEIGHSLLASATRNGAAGLVLGVALGCGWVIVWEITGNSVRHRDQVTAALRAPVAVSVGAQPGPLAAHRLRFERQQLHPSPSISQVVYHLRQTLALDGRRRQALGVVSVASDGPAAVAAAALAVQLSDEGRGVLLADCSRRSVLTRLLRKSSVTVVRTADATPTTCAIFLPGGQRIAVDDRRLEISFEDLRRNADVVLVLASLDPAVGAHFLGGLTSTVVAFVTAGRSTATALHSAALMLDDAEIRLDSVVLVGTDPGDETLGVPVYPSPPPAPPSAAVEAPPLRSSQRP